MKNCNEQEYIKTLVKAKEINYEKKKEIIQMKKIVTGNKIREREGKKNQQNEGREKEKAIIIKEKKKGIKKRRKQNTMNRERK